jgi:hypothetical protein
MYIMATSKISTPLTPASGGYYDRLQSAVVNYDTVSNAWEAISYNQLLRLLRGACTERSECARKDNVYYS